MIACYYFNNPT